MKSHNPAEYDRLRGISFCVWMKTMRATAMGWIERKVPSCMCREDKTRCVHYWPLHMDDHRDCAFWKFDGVATCTNEEAQRESMLEDKMEEL